MPKLVDIKPKIGIMNDIKPKIGKIVGQVNQRYNVTLNTGQWIGLILFTYPTSEIVTQDSELG